MVALSGLGAGWCDTIWTDDFTRPMRYEQAGPRVWSPGDGRCAFRAADDESELITLTQNLDALNIRVDLTPEKRNGTTWTYAGSTLFKDANNHWRLMLVEDAGGRRYFELIERLDGEHQAQSATASVSTRLGSTDAGNLQAWEYGRTYRLELALTSDGISGTITDLAGGGFWQRTYSFAQGRAVKSGRGGLVAKGTVGVFNDFLVEGSLPAAGDGFALPEGDRTALVVPDESGQVAGAVTDALRRQGFAVAPLAWEDVARVRLPWERLDLLVIADARRVPVGVRDQLVTALHSAGKVVAIGAPAFSELLVQTPRGWRGAKEWTEAFAEGLERAPILIEPDAWIRSAHSPDRNSSLDLIAREPQTWHVTTDLMGWDTHYAEVAGAFSAERPFLVFEARGDENTDGLAIELIEKDKSRWIGTVDLTTEWRTYVVRPADLPYWEDSQSRGRGGAGDHVRPQDVVRMAIGLARSHMPRIKDGDHSYWVRGLSTGGKPGVPDPNFDVPDVEILCPSYKLYPMGSVARIRPAQAAVETPWTAPAYAPVWREQGRGIRRGRAWRWVPVVEALDAAGKPRGAVVSYMIGDGSCPTAVWGNVAVADPKDVLAGGMLEQVAAMSARMADGCFLLEGGAELFSYFPGEAITLGAKVLNTGRRARTLGVRLVVTGDGAEAPLLERTASLEVAPGRDVETAWVWERPVLPAEGCEVTVELLDGERVIDTISHRIERLRDDTAGPEEFVRAEGSNFMLGDRKWFFNGINYRPSWIGGYAHLNFHQRECYDPEIIERDLTWMQSIGINALSAIHALTPPNPDDPRAYRDQLDFLERCDRHGMKCFFIVPRGRPYQGEDVQAVKEYIQRAGLKDHPAIMCWELAWEPIDVPWKGGMDFFTDDWNAWVRERYGSIESAVADWGFSPERDASGRLPVPTVEQCRDSGEWDAYVAAFRRAYSDKISARYRDIVLPLREWDPKHLISFRGGACGIPHEARFAHIHSVGVARLMDFLNPEGYNLQTGGWANPTPPDDIRKGGLVTLYYRYISREKPVVWMEFGFTVNGFHRRWEPDDIHIDPAELERQYTEYDSFYRMFLESGARGAAPWWLPGGFRLGENSDFGIIEPDGAERPVVEILRRSLPLFERVQHPTPTRMIDLDLDAHYPDSWPLYSAQYLDAVKQGQTPYLRSAGTGTDSTNCPLTAVGGSVYNGSNPPLHLNAEFDRIELKVGEGEWVAVKGGETLQVPAGAAVQCRARVGNNAEAEWTAPTAQDRAGTVFLTGFADTPFEFLAPIAADTPFLGTAEVPAFTLLSAESRGKLTEATPVTFAMLANGRATFGERRTVTLRPVGGE